jgi:hypothetical protein
MKSAEDKARDFVSALPLSVAVVRKEVEALTVRLLKEQDRDTRHACADAVTKLRGQMGEGGDPFTAAGNACMNVKAA